MFKTSPALKHTCQVATDIRLLCYTFILAVKVSVKISVWLGQNCLKVSELWDLYFSLTRLKMCWDQSIFYVGKCVSQRV